MIHFSKLIYVSTIVFFAFTNYSFAAVITAQSCSQPDVQQAVDSSNDGDIIKVPPGNCTWTTSVSFGSESNSVYTGKSITIIGAGIDKTIITDATSSAWTQAIFWIYGEEGKPFRISGFTFKGPSSPSGLLKILGDCKNWRIDHCKFIDWLTRAIAAGHTSGGATYGLIDHCIFEENFDGTAQGVSVFSDGDAAWNRPLSLGSENAVYVEDCIFNYAHDNDGALDAFNGARYVFRHNQVNNTFIGHHGRDSGGLRSTHSYEIYNNIFSTEYNLPRYFLSRGGTGVFFNNTFSGTSSAGVQVSNYCSCKDQSSCADPWEECTNYPCVDQIGRTTGQSLSPLYEWNNLENGLDIDLSIQDFQGCVAPTVADHVQEGRDYYNDLEKPGYEPFTYPHPLTKPYPPDTFERR